MDRINLCSDEIYVNVDSEEDDSKCSTKSKIKSRNVPSKVYTLRFRNNLKEKLDSQHDLQFQMRNRNGLCYLV